MVELKNLKNNIKPVLCIGRKHGNSQDSKSAKKDVYINRKKFGNFYLKPYLTRRRQNTLDACRQYLVCNERDDVHNVDFIFADADGNLKFLLHDPSHGKHFLSFRTEDEYHNKVQLSVITERDNYCERSHKHFMYN